MRQTPLLLLACTLALVMEGPCVRAAAAADPPRPGRYMGAITSLEVPGGVAIDAGRRIYVSCAASHVVRVFDEAATPLVAWGRCGGALGEFREPRGLAFDAQGDLFVVDSGNHRVQRFTLAAGLVASQQTSSWGAVGGGPGQLRWPTGVAVNGDRVLVADTGNRRLQAFTRAGVWLWTADASSLDPEPLLRPAGVAAGAGDTFYVVDADTHRVLHLAANGDLLGAWGGEGGGGEGGGAGFFGGPSGIASGQGPDFALLVADPAHHRIQLLAADASPLQEWGGHLLRPREGLGLMHYPDGVACTRALDLVVVMESFENRCQLFALAEPGATGEDPTQFPRDQEFHFGPRCAAYGDLLALTEPDRLTVGLYRIPAGAAGPPVRVGTAVAAASGLASISRYGGVALAGPAGPLVIADDPARRLVRFGLPPPRDMPDPGASPPPSPPSQVQPFSGSASPWNVLGALQLATLSGSTAGAVPVVLGELTAVRLASHGGCVILDAVRSQVVVIDARGDLQAHWSGIGVPVDAASLDESAASPFPGTVDLSAAPDGRWWRATDVALSVGAARAQEPLGGPAGDGRAAPAVGEQDRIYLVDAIGCRVLAFDAAGRWLFSFGVRGDAPGQFRSPFGITATAAGSIYVTDSLAHTVQRFAADGTFRQRWGLPGVRPGEFFRPAGIAQLGDGTLCVVDHGNHRVQFFSPDGVFLGMFGSPWFMPAPARGSER